MKIDIGELSNNWQQHTKNGYIMCYRKGWLGVWDQIRAWITGKERYSVETPITISVWAKKDSNDNAEHLTMDIPSLKEGWKIERTSDYIVDKDSVVSDNVRTIIGGKNNEPL